MVTTRRGRRIGFAVKATREEALRADVEGVLRAIKAGGDADVADRLASISMDRLDPVAVLNAQDVLERGLDQDHRGLAAVGAALRGMGRTITLREVAHATRFGDRGVRAAVALVQAGALVIPRGERLRPDLQLENRRHRDLSRTKNR